MVAFGDVLEEDGVESGEEHAEGVDGEEEEDAPVLE